jgi:hypothetical protein
MNTPSAADVCSTTAWFLWWRVSAAGLRLRAVAREREIGRAAVGRRLGLGERKAAPLHLLI